MTRLVAVALVVACAVGASGCANLRVGVNPLTSSTTSSGAVRLWPLLNIEPAPDARPDLEKLGAPPRPGRASFIYPFGSARWLTDEQGRKATFWGIHPIVSRSSFPARAEGDARAVVWEVIYPFFEASFSTIRGRTSSKYIFLPIWLWQEITRTSGEAQLTAQRSFFFPLWWQGTDTAQLGDADPVKLKFQYLLPFWWYNNGASHDLPFFNPKGRKMLGLWPFFVFLDSYNGRTYRSFLWPLIVYSWTDEDTQRALSLLWPIFRVQWGGEKEPIREVRMWPLFGFKWSEEKFSRYVLYPLFIWRNASTLDVIDRALVIFPFWISGDYKESRYRIFFPNSGWYTDEDESIRFVLWPLYTRWEKNGEEDEKFVEHQVFWHLFRWRDGTGDQPNTYHQVYPFYRYVERPNRKYWYHPILFWHGTERNKAGYTFHGRYSYFWLSWKTREFEDGFRDWSRILAPFAHWKGDNDGELHLRMLWLLYEEAGDGIRRNWTPLWNWFSYDRDVLRDERGDFARPNAAAPRDIEMNDDLRRGGNVVGMVRQTEFAGGLYRSYSAPGQRERHWNIGPIAYDHVNGERAFSIFGGWFPVRWGTPDPPAEPLAPPTRAKGKGLAGWLEGRESDSPSEESPREDAPPISEER